jgi:diguanylate cyclase (GGDEF)-like protein
MLGLLEQERQRCVRSGRGFCLALIDIDHFKQINERHGHGGGDALLRSFAREALGAIRVADVLARWDGETFALLLSDARLPLARGGVERLRLRIEAAALLDGKPTQRITVSAGLAEHIAGEAVSDALARADRALYQAKAEGRNRTVAASGGTDPS